MVEDKTQQDSKALLLEAGAAARQKLYQGFLMRIKAGESLSRSEIKAFQELEKQLEISDSVEDAARINGFGAAAEFCGVSKRTISYHLKRGNLRQNADGTFERSELEAWLARYGRKKGVNKDLFQKRLEADLRYRLARAEREETLVQQLRGELFHMNEISEAWAWRASEYSAALQSLVDRLPPVLVDKERMEIQGILSEEVYSIKERMFRDGRFTPTESA